MRHGARHLLERSDEPVVEVRRPGSGCRCSTWRAGSRRARLIVRALRVRPTARAPPSRSPMPNYLPYDERRPSTAVPDMLRTIRDDGVRVQTKQGEDALAVAGAQMRFPMAHGAAVITERSIAGFVRKPIGELCAFINGARTLEELRGVRLRLVGRVGDAGEDAPRAAWRPATSAPAPTATRSTTSRPTSTSGRPGLRPAPASGAEAAGAAAGPHGGDEPVDPAANHRDGGRQVAQHDRAVPRLDARAGPRRQLHLSQPALRRHAGRRPVQHGAVHRAGADARAAHRLRVRRVRPHDPDAHIYADQLERGRRDARRASRARCRRCT